MGFQNLKSENGMKLYSSIFIAAAAVVTLFESSVHARSDFQSANHNKLSQEKTFFDHSSNAKTKLQKRQAKKFMRLYDLNDDGRVTVDEITEDHRRMLQAIDIDDSQGLAPKEMRRRGSNLKLWQSVTIFDLLDHNGNQEITALELSRPAQRWFKRHDLNDDGVLKTSEIFIHLKRDKKGKKQRRRFKNFIKFCDLNENGEVTIKEIVSNQVRILRALDINNNKSLSLKELKRRGRGLKRCRSFNRFDLLDINGDRQITANELHAPMKRWFKRHDANRNGSIESVEVPLRRWHRLLKRKRRYGWGSK